MIWKAYYVWMTFLFLFRPSPVASVKEIKVTKHPEKEDNKNIQTKNWNFACFQIQPIDITKLFCLSWSAERDDIVGKAKEKKEYPTKEKNKQDPWKKTKIEIKRRSMKHEIKLKYCIACCLQLVYCGKGYWDTKKDRLHASNVFFNYIRQDNLVRGFISTIQFWPLMFK